MDVSTVMVIALLDAAQRAGVSRDRLLAPLGIDPARLTEVEGRFALDEFARIQMRALDLTGDDALGLHMAEETHSSVFGLVAHLVAHAPTLRESLGVGMRFQRLVMDDSCVTAGETSTSVAIRYQFARSFDRADRMRAEFIATGILRIAQVFGGASVTPQVASFEHPRPDHAPEYQRIFGDVVRFDQPFTGLTFDRALLDRVRLPDHAELFSVLRSQAERTLDRVAAGRRSSERVRQYLRARPPARIPDVSTVARDLGLSARSLRRHLTEDATSYRALVRETLEASAGQMLCDPRRSIQETAFALGFSNASAFHRAFKRWTGVTPAEYRERQGRVS